MELNSDQQQDEIELGLVRVIGPALDRGVSFDVLRRALACLITIVGVAENITAMGKAGEAMLDKAVQESRKGMH